jgi:hypothetical protein
VWGQHPYTARADAILRYRDTGELVIADTKTRAAAIPGSTQRKPPNEAKRRKYARGLRTRPQFCGLVSLADKLLTHSAENPPALLVNAIIKTKVPTFDRLLVHYTRRDLEWWQASQQACSRRGFSEIPLPNPEACAPEIGSRCSYFQWCHGTDDERQKFYEEQKS